MGRAPIINPVIPSTGNEELYRSVQHVIDQLERHFNRSGYVYTVPLFDIVMARHVYLIPRVGLNGFNLGRVAMTAGKNYTPDGTLATISADASNYWTFTLYRYFTSSDGSRTSRPIPGGTWNTSETAMRVDVPKVVFLKRPLDPGDTLVLKITPTGTAPAFSGTIQVEETFGPEE